MTRIARLAAAVLLLVSATACGDGNGKQRSFMDAYAGAPYLGHVEVNVFVPDDPARAAISDSGSGSAQFVDEGNGKARLIVAGRIRDKDDAGFSADGDYDGSGWSSGDSSGVRLALAPDGTVSGSGTASAQKLRFDGRISDAQFDLTSEIVLLETSAKGLPPGTRFVFRYKLRRVAAQADTGSVARTGAKANANAKADARARRKPGNEDCKRIIWRTRNIAGFSGAPMQMIQVPECVRW